MRKKVETMFIILMVILFVWITISFIDVIMHNNPEEAHNYFTGNAFVLFNKFCQILS